MVFDYKKQYKEFYLPKNIPAILSIPQMYYIAIQGIGNPNEENGEYQKAIGILYAIAYTLKMSYKGSHKIDGFFEYVVPPLEGFWWQDGIKGVDYQSKQTFNWISVIRLPNFVTESDFEWAKQEAEKKKKIDCGTARFLCIDEGMCVQCMHYGSFDSEPRTVELMHKFMVERGYVLDINERRMHHEIYLSDPRKTKVERLKTVIRHPIKQQGASK